MTSADWGMIMGFMIREGLIIFTLFLCAFNRPLPVISQVAQVANVRYSFLCAFNRPLPAVSKDKDKKVSEIINNTVAAYGGLATLIVLRQSGQLRGLVKLYTGSDTPQEGEITIRFMRRPKVAEDLKRIDLKLPTAPKFTIAFDGTRVWGAENDSPVVLYLRSEAAMKAELLHNYEALLRSQELETKPEYVGEEKRSGLQLYMIDMKHSDGSTTRYYISAKTWRILHLEYEITVPSTRQPIRVRESFYDFRVVQSTLAPFRIVRYEDDHLVQEINFTEVTFGVQVDKSIFEAGGGASKGSS